MAVLNLALGGNRVWRDGVGPNALSRLDRDVLAQPGVRWLIVLEGVNDIGAARKDRANGEWAPTADDMILAYEQIIERAHARGILVYGGTIMPFEGFKDYDSPEAEADRQRVNAWIRTSGGSMASSTSTPPPATPRARRACRRQSTAAITPSLRRRLPDHGRGDRSRAVRCAEVNCLSTFLQEDQGNTRRFELASTGDQKIRRTLSVLLIS